MLLIGTDEAGYGPNFGPLVVSASVWSTPTDDLSSIRQPLESKGISIGDSKKLYHSSGSIAPLEIGVLSAIRSMTPRIPLDYPQLIDLLVNPVVDPPFWEKDHPVPCPLAVDESALTESAKDFSQVLASKKVQLADLRARVVSAQYFNRLLEQHDSKGTMLSDLTLGLVAENIRFIVGHGLDPKEKIVVLCDKHGGRNHYLDVLNRFFPDEFIQVIREGRDLSVYRFKLSGHAAEHPVEHSVEIRFKAKGESEIPIALASMFSKYLRERAMVSFNEFWSSKIPDLRPTAGYPEDAKRFLAEISDTRRRLKIGNEIIWRKK